MNRESVIIKTLEIKNPTQVCMFQIRIPREVENIVGVEMGMNWTRSYPSQNDDTDRDWKLPLTMNTTAVVGELKLQSFEKSNMFYSGELALDRSMDFGDFTYNWFKPYPYTHQFSAFEDSIAVPGTTTLINGVFKDTLYIYGLLEYQYTVKIYIWLQSKETEELLVS